jgi:cytochrome c
MRHVQLSAVTFAAAALMCGCTGGHAVRSYEVATGGYAQSGRQLVVQYRCGKCHTIPGIPHADGVFGPPLTAVARRTLIAGEFPNVPANLAHWIQSPKSMKPKTTMPQLGLSEQESRDVAAYLYTLR